MKVAFVSPERYWVGKYTGELRVEPSHLVRMHHILASKGIGSKIIVDRASDSLLAQVQNYRPDVLCVSVLAHVLSAQIAPLIDHARQNGIKVVLGGSAITTDPGYYAKEYRPDAVVLGQGEPAIGILAGHDFQFGGIPSDLMNRETLEGVPVFSSPRLVKFDDANYERPYSLKPFGHSAYPVVIYGCAHKCNFCTSDGRFVMRDPENFVEELVYLQNKLGATKFTPIGGDFGASPKRATEIIERILKRRTLLEPAYDIRIRIDNLASAISMGPKIWKKFLSKGNVLFELGVESSLPQKLHRLNKYRDTVSAEAQRDSLMSILEFIKPTPARAVGSFIMLDPESTVDEVVEDLEWISNTMSRYPDHFLVNTGDIFNYLRPVRGSRADEIYADVNMNGHFFMNLGKDGLMDALQLYMFGASPSAVLEFGAGPAVDRRKTTRRHIGLLGEAIFTIYKNLASSNKITFEFLADLVLRQFPGADKAAVKHLYGMK